MYTEPSGFARFKFCFKRLLPWLRHSHPLLALAFYRAELFAVTPLGARRRHGRRGPGALSVDAVVSALRRGVVEMGTYLPLVRDSVD